MTAIKYTAFAVISSLGNLLFQYLSFALYEGIGFFYVAMFSGIIAGLVTKYILDKKWIFHHTPKNNKDNAIKFILYSFMGGITTMIFLVTEMAFYYLLPYPNAHYIGAVIGLTIGYSIKYFLDKKYVFIDKEAAVA